MVGSVRRCHNVFLMISFEHKMDLKIEHVGAIRRWYVFDFVRSVARFGVLVPFVGCVGFDSFCL